MEPAPAQALRSSLPNEPAAARPAWHSRVAIIAGALTIIALVPLICHALGFIGISNDDAARSLIAWDFSHAPQIDPTRSSWLPVPTYLLGSVLAVTRELGIVPRAFSLLCAVASFAFTVRTAQALGASTGWASWAGAVPMLFAWSFYPSWSPGSAEMYAACFVCGAYTILVRGGAAPSRRRIVSAGLILSLACGSRYEAWLVSLGFVGAFGWYQRHCPSRIAAFVAAAALGPIGWLAINAHRSGDPIEFIHRVATFRSLEHAAPRFAWSYPAAIAAEMGILVALAFLSIRTKRFDHREAFGHAGALTLAIGLVAMDVRGGGATHHPDRALALLPWLLSPAVAVRLQRVARRGVRFTVAALVAAQLAFTLRDLPREIDPATIAAGRAVGRLAPTRYFVETGRQDFLWLEFASGVPERATPDRPYGAPGPDSSAEPSLAAGLPLAVVHRNATVAAFRAAGWTPVADLRGWRALQPPR